MMKILQSLFFLMVSYAGLSQAICGFDEMHQKMLKTDPAFLAQYEKNEAKIREFTLNYANSPQVNGPATALFNIPVVVHVVHTGGDIGSIYNPSDAQITAVIDYLNGVYDGTASGIGGGAGDIQIQFALAKRDPNCNPTNGIVHVNAGNNAAYVANGVNRSGASGISDLALKNLSRWDVTQYYNIWLVNKIDGKDGTSGQFVAGYAYFPGAPTSLDGTVMLATQMEVGDKVLPHEIGHALNLYHPFEGSSGAANCPPNTDCTIQGDRVCDTDPISNNTSGGVTDFSCRSGNNSCTNTPYSPNTESNIMSYTECFNLFTAGQKTRMLAAMTLPSRASLATSLGATATNMGANPCPPKIVFQNVSSAVIEDAGTVSDCRTYKDYTINMIIGNSPSQAATATLTTTGTASAGADFILTTNGNFVSPSNVLNFPEGQNGLRPFTVRIFDDGAIEDNETIIINYTVNNGGGNAVKGESITTHTLTIYDDDVEPDPLLGNASFIGDYTTNLTGSPFLGQTANYKGQMIYRASELQAAGMQAGTIMQIAFYVATKNSTIPFNGFTIKMKNATEINTSSTPIAGATTVYGPVDYSTVAETNVFNLSTPFAWDGTSSLLVEICWSNGTTISVNDIVAGNSGLSGSHHNLGLDASADGCTLKTISATYASGTSRPMAGFTIVWPGPGIETVLNQSGTSYLGPNSDVYFYSQTGNILARIKNTSNHDYGCTEVKIDRAGTTTKGLVNNVAKNQVADKTISITPANNNPSGTYDLTLYYTLSEITGWENATGLAWPQARIIKTTNAVSSYTPGAVPIAHVQERPSTHDDYGVDSTITASVNSGFSGFAVGNITDVLPVTWLEFKGALQNSNAVLIWKVQEVNNAAFDLEVSRNGQDFVSLYKTPSKGNNNAANIYQYKQARPEAGINYYRVKQIDIDGRFTYSQTITLNVDGKGGGKPFVYPVPAKNTIVLNFGEILTRGSWEIFSADMRLVQRQKLSASALQQQINISQLPAGVYFIRLITDNNQEMLRFVKE